jgi:hypothetical protein
MSKKFEHDHSCLNDGEVISKELMLSKNGKCIAIISRATDAFTLEVYHDIRDMMYLYWKEESEEDTFVFNGDVYQWKWVELVKKI